MSRTKSNMSAVLRSVDVLRLINRVIPKPSSNEVLIAVNTVGISSSDIHYWKNGRVGNNILKKPMVLGHETSGIVLKVGDNVKHLKPGDRVCIGTEVPCRRCEFCMKGHYNLCSDVKSCSTSPYDGSLCQYYCHAADFCYKLPDHVSLEEGALIEPLSVGVHTCRQASIMAGSSVLICGAGLIGLFNVLVTKAMGASKICITDISENRLEVTKKLGATHQVCIKDKNTKELIEEIKSKLGCPPDATIECSGAELSIKLAILVTKSEGAVILAGRGAPKLSSRRMDAAVREVDIRPVLRYTNCFRTALDLVASEAVDVKALITHRFTLKDTLKAFETAHTGAGGAIKVLINCCL